MSRVLVLALVVSAGCRGCEVEDGSRAGDSDEGDSGEERESEGTPDGDCAGEEGFESETPRLTADVNTMGPIDAEQGYYTDTRLYASSTISPSEAVTLTLVFRDGVELGCAGTYAVEKLTFTEQEAQTEPLTYEVEDPDMSFTVEGFATGDNGLVYLFGSSEGSATPRGNAGMVGITDIVAVSWPRF